MNSFVWVGGTGSAHGRPYQDLRRVTWECSLNLEIQSQQSCI